MTGRITRLVDDHQIGAIVGDDGAAYLFHTVALGTRFSELFVGATVTCTPVIAPNHSLRADAVRRLISK
jgi:hypothetical protein